MSILAIAIALFGVEACKTHKLPTREVSVDLDSMEVKAETAPVYNPSRTREIDILHTRLELAFNWDSSFVLGKATITFKPYFYPLKKFTIDARGFKLNKVALKKGEELADLKYAYDGRDINIILPEEMQSADSAELFIDYIAMPDKIEVKGSAAITEDKGLYFINSSGEDKDKPRQLWTQGETEANSCWFPTVDSPNEKFTTDIYLTIEKGQISISNGVHIFSLENPDGSKTEHWKMDKPHSAYLVMIAVGPFTEVKDSLGDMQVNYYLDSAYKDDAMAIFGNTPEMIQFFGDYLGVPYPWQKYDQVVVHDYVSGAMENTTAVIHGDFVQLTRREMIDYDHEDVISHELFHHWFGDLVTCESWSNLTLNEGFATYGEYLWNEHKYGIDEADENFHDALDAYLDESQYNNHDLINFSYNDKEDMFDSHSYAKGGRVLHMLRMEVGEEAFRAGLNRYLKDHAYGTVEVHDLRLAFEAVTGRDMNWFFNQWYLASGHPVLEINHTYLEHKKELLITVSQNQDLSRFPLYRLPMDIEIGQLTFNGQSYGPSSRMEKILIENRQDTFRISVPKKPTFVNFDVGENLLLSKDVKQGSGDWIAQYKLASRSIDRNEALRALMEDDASDVAACFRSAMKDAFWVSRALALEYFEHYLESHKDTSLLPNLRKMAESDDEPYIRSTATSLLSTYFSSQDLASVFLNGISDSSYEVLSESFRAYSRLKPAESQNIADDLEAQRDQHLNIVLAEFYSNHGDEDKNDLFLRAIDETESFGKYQVLIYYSNYLERQNDSVLITALPLLREYAVENDTWWMRMAGMNAVMNNHANLNARCSELRKLVSSMKDSDPLLARRKGELASCEKAYEAIDKLWKEITVSEKYDRLQSIIQAYNSKGVNLLEE